MLNYAAEREQAPRWVTAIDVALVPDLTLVRHAIALNTRFREPRDVHSLDAAYHLRLTTLQCYVNTGSLLDVYAGTGAIMSASNPAAWEMTAVGYEAVESDDGAAAVRLHVHPDEAWLQLQHQLVFTLVPHFDFPGTGESVAPAVDDDEFEPPPLESVVSYIPSQTGSQFRPHLDMGVASAEIARAIVAEAFEPFTFRPAGAAIYHLNCAIADRVRLKWWTFPSESAEVNSETAHRALKRSRAQQGARTFRRRLRLLEQ
jgi:hypothetical protein